MSPSPILEMRNISKTFGPVRALRDVSLTVYRGELHALMGENGAGKSTLIRIMSGAHQPNAGTLTVDGRATRFAGPREAQAAGIIGGRGAADLIAAYDLIQTARLEIQAAQIRAGERPGNHLAPADLPNLERSHLRDAFVVVRGAQSALGHGKGLMG